MDTTETFLCIGIADVGGIARSGNFAGYDMCTIDYFGDTDVKSYSKKSLSIIEEYGEKKVDKSILLEKLLKLVRKLIANKEIDFTLLSSGLDDNFDFLFNLNELIPIMGNDPNVFRKVRDKENFFKDLKQMGLAFPRTFIVNDFYEALWAAKDIGFPIIIKPQSGFGGLGVKKINDKKVLRKFYKMELKEPYLVQEYITGIPASISILSNGMQGKILSINEQLLGVKDFGQREEFVYCGNIIPLDIDVELKKECEEIKTKIVKRFKLNGTNGIDIIFSNLKKKTYIIEVNPRFQGTSEILENYLNINLVNAHKKACLYRELIKCDSIPKQIYYLRALLYAKNNLLTPDLSNFDFVRDIPRPGLKIKSGKLVCSVLSDSQNRKQCFKKAKRLAKIIYKKSL